MQIANCKLQIERRGFTLVEMLVAMALVIFIMAIMSEAFIAGLDSFRQLKSIGDMDMKLRAATTLLRNDLRAVRFNVAGATTNPQKLSQIPTPPLPAGSEGFFRLWQGSSAAASPDPAQPYFNEGSDPDGIQSYRATDHMLHFSVYLGPPPYDPTIKVNRLENFLAAAVGAASPLRSPPYTPAAFDDAANTSFYSQWAEVAWFLRETGTTTEGDVTATAPNDRKPMALYALYRRQLLAVTGTPPNTVASAFLANNPADYQSWSYYAARTSVLPEYVEVSCKDDPQNSGILRFNTPRDLTMPVRRFGMDHTSAKALAGVLASNRYPIFADEQNSTSAAMKALAGADLILTNVVSLDVKVCLFDPVFNTFYNSGQFVDLFDGGLQPRMENQAFDGIDDLNPPNPAAEPRAIDTWSSDTVAPYDYSTSGTTGPPPTYVRVPLRMQVRALQITLRIWDEKTKRTRQITVVQDM